MGLTKVSSTIMSPRLINFSMALGAFMTTTFGFLSILYPQIAFIFVSYSYGYPHGFVSPFDIPHIWYFDSQSDLGGSIFGFLTLSAGGILFLTSLIGGRIGKNLVLLGLLMDILGIPITLIGIPTSAVGSWVTHFMPGIGTLLMLLGVSLSFAAAMLRFQRRPRRWLVVIPPILILLSIHAWIPLLLTFNLISATTLYHYFGYGPGIRDYLLFFLGVIGWLLAIGQILDCSIDIKKALKELMLGGYILEPTKKA